MKKILFVIILFLTSELFAYHPVKDQESVKDITQKNQKTCGLVFQVKAEEDGDLLNLNVLVPVSVCPDDVFLKQAILEISETREGEIPSIKPLLVCPLANFEGCDFKGMSLTLKFQVDKSLIGKAHLVLVYGRDKPLTYRVHLDTYLRE